MIAAYHGSLAAVYASLLLDVWTRDNCSSCCSVLLSTSRCLFLFEIIISGGSWRPQCLQSHRHLCTGQCISLCSSFPPVSTYSAHPSHHWFHSNCGLLLGCQRPKQQWDFSSHPEAAICFVWRTKHFWHAFFGDLSQSRGCTEPCCQQVKKGHSPVLI